MTNAEFQEIIHDFDKFMAEHGYYDTNTLADALGIAPVSVRQRINRGYYPGTVMIGNKLYVPMEYAVERGGS